MNSSRVLAIVLAVQLVLVAISWWPGDPAASRPRALFDYSREAVEEISIGARPADGADSDPVVLARSGAGWVVRSPAVGVWSEIPASGALLAGAGAGVLTQAGRRFS